MKNRIIIVLLCLACGLCSCTQTDSSRKKSEGKVMTAEIDSNYYLQDTIQNPYKKVENALEKKDCDTSIWIKDTNNDKSTTATATTTKSTAYPWKIINEIHSSSGLFCDSEKLKEYTEKINIDNVINVVNGYKKEYGHSIFKAIMRNVFLSSEVRTSAVKHIKDMLMQALKRSGTYTEDYDKLIDGHIEYEKNKFGRMNSKDIDEDLRALFDRHKQTRRGKRYNKLIPANGKIDATFNQGCVGDCWLLSAIKSLSIHPKGLEMLENLISIDNKGNVTVQLKGVKRTYTIPKEELEGANEFAQGDLDIRAIELAVNKYIHEIGDHGGNEHNDAGITHSYYDIYDGMYILSIPYKILFGNKKISDIQPDNATIEKIKSGKYATVVTRINPFGMSDVGLSKRHVYAVTGANNKYVYLSNPYDPDTKLKVTHKVFLKFFDRCYSMKL